MEAINLEEAQRRLDEKRAILKQTNVAQIGSVLAQGMETVERTCTKHGISYQADAHLKAVFRFHPNAGCPECAAESEAEEAESKRIRKSEQRRERIAARLSNLAIGERFRGATWDSYKTPTPKMKATLRTCQRYVEQFDPRSKIDNNMIFVGSPGTGKNMLAAIICMEIIRRDFTAVHTTAMKMIRTIKDSWRDREVSEQETIRKFYSPDLLVIDEIGVQFGSDTEKLYLTEIINERYEQFRPTILISNLTIPQIEEALGKRAIDRFYEGESRVLVFDWSSYRRVG